MLPEPHVEHKIETGDNNKEEDFFYEINLLLQIIELKVLNKFF